MLTFDRGNISDALSRAAKVASRKDDIRRWAMLEASNGTAVITAVSENAEIGIRLDCPCEGPSFKTLFPAALVSGFVNSLTGDNVSLELGENCLRITDGSATFEPGVRDADEFTAWTTPPGSVVFTAGKFSPAVHRVSWAADTESTRYALAGVQLKIADGRCRLAATDSRCLAIEHIDVDTDQEWEGVIPTQAITFAAHLMAGDFTMFYGQNEVEFRGIDTAIYARLQEGRFPNIDAVVPADNPQNLELSTGALSRVVKQGLLVIDEKQSVKAAFELGGGNLTVDARSDGKGHATIKLPVASDLRTGVVLDLKFLDRFTSRLDGGDQLTWFIKPDGANKFNVNGRDCVVVIMPLATE